MRIFLFCGISSYEKKNWLDFHVKENYISKKGREGGETIIFFHIAAEIETIN